MTRSQLTCIYCLKPIVKSRTNAFTAETQIPSGIERAWHANCVPNYAEPESPFQCAVQKAKQAIADARRLDLEQYDSFAEIVKIALTEQRLVDSETGS